MRDNTTPRPWSTSREDMDSFTVNQDDTTGETEHVVYIYRGDQPRIGVFAGKLDNARADANLIVEAVNSYSARVARAMESIATPEPAADPRVAEAVRYIKNRKYECPGGATNDEGWCIKCADLIKIEQILTAQAGDEGTGGR
jgi:hypothetical protein